MSLGTPKFQGKKRRNRGNFLTKEGSMVGHLISKVPETPEFSEEDPLGWVSMCWLSWFSGPVCCNHPGFHLRLGASDCSPALAFCFMGPWTFAWICCPQLPYHPCKNGTHSTSFYSTGGDSRKFSNRVFRRTRVSDFKSRAFTHLSFPQARFGGNFSEWPLLLASKKGT